MLRINFKLVITILIFMCSTTWSVARPGDLDTSFANNGVLVVPHIGWMFNVGSFLRPDNKLAITGYDEGNQANFYYFFDENGNQTESSFPLGFYAIQSDRKIVVVNGFSLSRYLENGTLDTAFGTGGTTVTNILNVSYALAVHIQPDGKIILGGYANQNNSYEPPGLRLVIVRYLPNGLLDPTFGNGGILLSSSEMSVRSREMYFQNGSKLLAVSSHNGITGITRFNLDATVDQTFGDAGVARFFPVPYFVSIRLQPSGRILVIEHDGWSYTIKRFSAEGRADTEFGSAGQMRIRDQGFNDLADIAIQKNGKIVLSGISDVGWLARYTSSGSLDASFGSGGSITCPVSCGHNSLHLQEDGKIITVGVVSGYDVTPRALRFENDAETANQNYFDYDGDGKTDLSVFRQTDGTWYVAQSDSNNMYVHHWGFAGDTVVPADYDGDGKTDLGVRRPSDNNFYVFNSSNSKVEVRNFGIAGDIPIPSDYNGDGKGDVAVWRPSNGTWYLSLSGSGIFYVMPWGLNSDKPAPGDFDGDGKTDLVVFRPSDGKWYTFSTVTGAISVTEWGVSGDQAVQGDYNGDGRTDFAVYRPSNNTWYRQNSNDGAVSTTQWGLPNDFPVPGDYDGDGKIDVAVWRPSDATWYVNRSGSGIFTQTFGVNGDTPTPSAFVF